jgi:hypothetical protein
MSDVHPMERRPTIPAPPAVPCPHCGGKFAAQVKLPLLFDVESRTGKTIKRVLEASELVFEVERAEQDWGHWSTWSGQG